MTTSVGTQVHFDPADVGHKYKRGGHATLDFTGSGCTYLYLHFDTPAKIDAVIAELVALKQEMDPPAVRVLASGRVLAPGEPVRDDWCPATTDMEDFGATLYCDRENGHPGSHHAPGPDEGSEVAWSDEPASVPHCGALWPNRGPAGNSWTCTLDKGHEGNHEAWGPGGPVTGRLFSSASQDDDEITWDEPASVTA